MEQNLAVEALPGPAIPPVETPAFHQLEPLLSIDQVVALTSLSKTTIWRLWSSGNRFPKPLILSTDRKGRPSRVAFRTSQIARWMTERQTGLARAA